MLEHWTLGRPGVGGFLATLVALSILLSACGAEKSKQPEKVSTKPAGQDRLRTKNDDTLLGRLKSEEFTIKSPYFKQLTLKRADVKEIEFDGDQDAVSTRNGDVIRGKLSVSKFTFAAKVGQSVEFERGELKRIELGR